MLTSATDVTTTTRNSRIRRSGSNGLGMPAMTEPTVMSTVPARTALIAPERLKPRISSSLRDRRDEIPLVQPARLVVDEDDPAADHDHREDRQHDRARQQVLDVRDVGIDLDDVERARRGYAIQRRPPARRTRPPCPTCSTPVRR